MKRRLLPLVVGSLVLPLGWGCNDDPTGPTNATDTFCSGQPDAAIVTFEDANLEAAIRRELSVGAQEDLTCGLVSGLTVLDARSFGITSLVGIENLTIVTRLFLQVNSISDISALSGLASLMFLRLDKNSMSDISALSGLTSLTYLNLSDNSITDISVLSGLTSLTELSVDFNSITDISALSGLTSLTFLDLRSNPDLSNIEPLLDNAGLGAGDTVLLGDTNVSCTDVAALQAKGVIVSSDC